jgi:hypothetical protein
LQKQNIQKGKSGGDQEFGVKPDALLSNLLRELRNIAPKHTAPASSRYSNDAPPSGTATFPP